MKKAFFFSVVSVLLAGCTFGGSGKGAAGERVNSIAVIIDDNLWLGAIGDSLRNKFAAPMTGLDQEEPMFTLNQYPAKLLEGYMTQSRNIIVIKKDDKLTRNLYQVRSDRYTRPQTIFTISGRSTADIIEVLQAHTPEMISRIKAVEILENQKQIRRDPGDDALLRKKFGLSMSFPAAYKPVLKKRKFLWYKKEITSGSSSLVVYQIPESALREGGDMTSKIVWIRNNYLGRYIRGAKPGSPMVTENSFTPYIGQLTIGGMPAYEMRGTWELANDFMQGPFITYCVHDRKHRRYVFLEGFCYAPSREKRDLMFELESILRSTLFNP